MAARPSLSPPIMARDSVLRHLHTHDPPGKAHPAGAGPPDPLRRCEKNLHAMPIDSDTSVLMAAEPYGITPRPRSPQGTSARAPPRTVPCSCTQAPAAERPAHPCVHALASPISSSFGALAQAQRPPEPGRQAGRDRRRSRRRWRRGGDDFSLPSPPLAERAPNPSARPEVALLPPQRPAAAPAAPHVQRRPACAF